MFSVNFGWYLFFKCLSIINKNIKVMNTTSKIVLGLMGAAAVGALIGILVAPEKGSELRKKISDGAGDVAEEIGKLLKAGKEELSNLKQSVTREAENLKGTAKEGVNRVKETV
jgi:gas vesicle protein